MNFPESPARSPSRSWLSSRCLRRARRRCPRNFLTCLTARSVMAGWASSLGHTLSDFGGVMQHLHGLRATGHDREHQRPLAARHAVDAAGRSPRVAAPSARAGVVGHAALEDEDLLVPEVAVAGDRGARAVAHQHCLPVALLPENLPVDTRPALVPGALARLHVEAPRRVAHDSSTSTAPSTTRTAYATTASPPSSRQAPVVRSKL